MKFVILAEVIILEFSVEVIVLCERVRGTNLCGISDRRSGEGLKQLSLGTAFGMCSTREA